MVSAIKIKRCDKVFISKKKKRPQILTVAEFGVAPARSGSA